MYDFLGHNIYAPFKIDYVIEANQSLAPEPYHFLELNTTTCEQQLNTSAGVRKEGARWWEARECLRRRLYIPLMLKKTKYIYDVLMGPTDRPALNL